MKKWNKENAIIELDNLINSLKQLNGSLPYSTEHTRWLFAADNFLREIFGQSSSLYLSFKKINWRYSSSRFVSIYEMDEIDLGQAKYDRHQLKKSIQFAEGILLAAKDNLTKHNIDDLYEGKNTSDEASSIIKIVHLLEHKLRKMIREQPQNEKLIRDTVENLLIASDTDYKREYPSISYSSKQYVPDFSFPKQSLALEIKICNRVNREKEIIKEINDDIMAYKLEFSNLLFLIYDLGFIRDVDLFSSEFEKDNSVLVKVIKH